MGVPVAGEDRFELRGELGMGATGAVYRVFDRQRREEVALKTLRRVGAGGDLYRFKREFRILAGATHPNLVTLHELFVVGDEWMYTMELVDGVSFDRWVRPGPRPPMIEDADEATVPVPRPDDAAVAGRLDLPRLRAALAQLADGLTALHALGKVHRDLKPSNVLVDGGGRPVILDFGLAVEPHVSDRTHEHGSVGTVAYMSPEQSADLPVTPATDWYAVGVMLYEGLTGQRPFRGAAHDVLLRKQLEDPEPPSALAAGVPADLDALCVRLVARDPADRPDGLAVLAALGVAPSAATQAVLDRAASRPATVDEPALAALREALAASRDHMVIAVVAGGPGAGKTLLLETFVDEIRRGGGLAITGTNNQREQTRLPGLDQALDQLSAYLVTLPRAEAAALLVDAAPLARMFPALRRLPALQVPTLPQARPLSPEEVVHQAMAAMRRLFARLAATRPFVFAVDGARGPDRPERTLFTDHFVGADMPQMLLVVLAQPEQLAASAMIANFQSWGAAGGDVRRIDLPGPSQG